IHPNLAKHEPKTHEVDQPCCMFIPRIFAIRDGDFVNFKNSSPISHNTKLDADDPSPSYNQTIAAKGNFKHAKPFVAQPSPVTFPCPVPPGRGGQFMFFDPPYYRVREEEGKFEIKDCPAGKYRIVYRHENGYHKGREGSKGWPIEIKPDGKGGM